jgi:hypothetical protein
MVSGCNRAARVTTTARAVRALGVYGIRQGIVEEVLRGELGKYTNCAAAGLMSLSRPFQQIRVADRTTHYMQMQLTNRTRVTGTRSVYLGTRCEGNLQTINLVFG